MANETKAAVGKASNLSLQMRFVHEQGQKFFPITHRRAIVGLSANTLTLSRSLEIDVNEADNTITINPVVQGEIDTIYKNIQILENKITQEINTQIQNLWDRVNGMDYALADSPGGVAMKAHRLNKAFTLTINGDGTGSTSIDGSGNVTLTLQILKTRNNYAGAATDMGPANSALKLNSARNIALTGAVTGNVNFDGSKNVSIATSVNHSHSQYSTTSHNHNGVYAYASHSHGYLPTGGGTLTGNLSNNARYYQNGTAGCLVAAQSGSPNGNMIWAW